MLLKDGPGSVQASLHFCPSLTTFSLSTCRCGKIHWWWWTTTKSKVTNILQNELWYFDPL